MDNRIFKVNGSGDDMLLQALKLVFKQEGDKTKCSSYTFNKKYGLVLCWSTTDEADNHPIPADLSAEECLPMVKAWLNSDDAGKVEAGDFEGDDDHDGHNSLGWLVYCEDWGHVGGNRYSICAIKRCYMWHGK